MPTIALAYIDVRPLLFAAGLPLFILLAILVCRLLWPKLGKVAVGLAAALVFVSAFVFFLTGWAPFVGQTEMRAHTMTWAVEPGANDWGEAEVVLGFAGFPGHYEGFYSDALAEHLRAGGKSEVSALFEITSDYGKVRGTSCLEVDGLRAFPRAWRYTETRGTPERSPWE